MGIILKIILIKIFIFSLFFTTSRVYSNPKTHFPEEYTATNQIGFIRHLISQDEYYRAFIELKRINSYYPGYIKKENLLTTEFYLLYKGRRFSEIPGKKINISDHKIRTIHTIFSSDALIEQSEFIKANNLLKPVVFSGSDIDIDFYLYKRNILSYLLLNEVNEARKLINDNINLNYSLDIANFSELTYYTENYFESFKKPYNAMFLGIIPGMGYVYSGKEATGIIAFLLISVLSTLTYYSFKTDNKPVGIFIGAATTFFYGGSILGGYLSAKNYNNTAINDLKHSLSLKMQIAEDRERIYNDYGIGRAGSK